MSGKGSDFYIGTDGRKHFVSGDFKKMQERNPHDVRCSKCTELIFQASQVKKYTEAEIFKKVGEHKCKVKN